MHTTTIPICHILYYSRQCSINVEVWGSTVELSTLYLRCRRPMLNSPTISMPQYTLYVEARTYLDGKL